MKKLLALSLAALMALSLLAACGGKTDAPVDTDDVVTDTDTTPDATPETPDVDAPAEPDDGVIGGDEFVVTPPEGGAPIDGPAAMPDEGGTDDEPYFGDGLTEPDAALCEILDAIYAESDPLYGSLETIGVDVVGAARLSYYTGLSDGSVFDAVIASEPMMSSQAYSMVIARVAEGQDAAAVARDILNNIDTRKWFCVSADDKAACVAGDIIMFVMVDEYNTEISSAQFVDAFNTLYDGTAVS